MSVFWKLSQLKIKFLFFFLANCSDLKLEKELAVLFVETRNRKVCLRKVNKSKQIRKSDQNQQTPLLVEQQNKKEVCMETFSTETEKLFNSKVSESQHTFKR